MPGLLLRVFYLDETMAVQRNKLKIVMDIAVGAQVEAEKVADGLVRDLQDDAVERWAGKVGALIAAAPRDMRETVAKPDNPRTNEVREVETQIAKLQRRLKELKAVK